MLVEGRLAQLARATRLHRVGQGFESLIAHQKKSNKPIIYLMSFQIIKEEKDYLVINKFSGLLVHGDGREDEGSSKTLCDLLLEKYPEMLGVGEPFRNSEGIEIEKPGIVHRLDKDTSGIMLVARTELGFDFLKEQFQKRTIKKIYHAFVYGNLKENSGIIDSPIGRSKKNFKQWLAGKEARGKMREAITEYKVLTRAENKEVTLVEVNLQTGRTHQIRVHFKSIYHPLVADNLYAPNRESLLNFKRVALHSKKIEFLNLNGEKVSYSADYPEDFFQALKLISK